MPDQRHFLKVATEIFNLCAVSFSVASGASELEGSAASCVCFDVMIAIEFLQKKASMTFHYWHGSAGGYYFISDMMQIFRAAYDHI